MHLVYIDESKETVGGSIYIYTALCIEASSWNDIFGKIKALRSKLKSEYGIHPNKELHAWKFASGKGQISDRPITKQSRAEIFSRILKYLPRINTEHKKFCLFNSVNQQEVRAFERLVNRIDRTMKEWDSYAILFFDDGQEIAFTKRIRKMRVINYIPSMYGGWEGGRSSQNIPLQRILEDPVFKDSAQSYFIQLVDFCAYALLRKEKPLESKSLLGYDVVFNNLEQLCFKQASPRDVFGIIR